MNRRTLLPLSALAMGLACLAGRLTLYRVATDATGLLKPGTPLEWGSYILSALALILFCFAARRSEGRCFPDTLTAAGQLLGAMGFGWTALRTSGQMPGFLGNLWRILGILSALSLIIWAFCTLKKKTPPFLPTLLPCLFWLTHLLDNYRGWSGMPQLQSYLFPLLGTMAMALFTYHTAALPQGMGNPRRRVFAALAAGYLCTAAAMPGQNQILYLTCGLWALSTL